MNLKHPISQRALALVLALPILFAAAHPAHSAADPAAVDVLQVRAYQGRELLAVVSGFAVNAAGAVVTSAHALRRAERFTVTAGVGNAEVVAALAWSDDDADVALLNATGIGAAPLVFAAGGLAAGRRVNTAWRAADGRLLTARGALGVADAGAPYQHNAMVTADGYGAPLLDECGRAVGINRRKPGRWLGFAASRAGDPEGVVFATAAPRILALLAANGVAYQAHAGPCVSAEQAARSSAAEAQAEAAAAEEAAAQARLDAEQAQQRADLSAAEKSELQAELQLAVEEKEQAAAAAQRAAEEATQQAATATQAEAAAEEAARARQIAQQTAEKNRRALIIGGVAVGLLALLALLIFIRRNRAARRRVAAAEAKALDAERRAEGPDPNSRPGWSFTVLADESGGETTTEVGAESAGDFYISAAVLQSAEQGVRVGRNPESCDVVVAAPAVSREHCRVFLNDGRLFLEDLKSANGTSIGARKLEAHAPEEIHDGDRVALGNIEFKVEYVT